MASDSGVSLTTGGGMAVGHSADAGLHKSHDLDAVVDATSSQNPSPEQPRDFVPKIQYSIEQLRTLRFNLPVVICNLNIMKSSVGDILKLPHGILANPFPQPLATNKLSLLPKGMEMVSRFDPCRRMSEDSDSEEIVYRGHASRKALAQNTQWHYRRTDRSGTDDPKDFQPRMAPTGDDAQKAENFRKFYRAVVSPTHVRVTAGGRIVPNSRAPAQPVFVWNKENFHFDRVDPPQPNTKISAEPKKDQSMESSYDSGTHASARSSYQKSDSSATAQSSENKDTTAQSNPASAIAQPSTAVPPGIKFSPPANFDATKPFILNGHMVVPVGAGFQLPPGTAVMPLGMIGQAPQPQIAFPAQQQMMGAFRSNAPVFGVPQNQTLHPQHNMMGQAMYPNHGSQHHGAVAQIPNIARVAQTTENMLRQQRSAPAMRTAARQQEQLSPKQINQKMAAFQSEVNKLDHQLTYNKHQISEDHVRSQRAHIMQQINVLKGQLSSLGFAPMGQQPENSPIHVRRGLSVTPSPLKGLGLSVPWAELDNPATPKGVFNGYYAGQKDGAEPKLPRATVSESAQRPAQNASNAIRPEPERALPVLSVVTTSNSGLVSKKRLSPSSAKAPEFKPRSMQATATTPNPTADENGDVFSTPVKGSQATTFGSSRIVVDLTAPVKTTAETVGTHFPQAAHPNMDNVAHSHVAPVSTMTYHDAPLSVQQPAVGNVGPYLSGYLPPGLHEAGVRAHEFSYSRPLTESEVLARQLYWGNGGRQHGQKGLPKFDGKDFYPASPTKLSTVSGSQGRSSETSTVVRKSNYSAVTSKASEESGALQKVHEEDTPRANRNNREISMSLVQQKRTEKNKENSIVCRSEQELDAWLHAHDVYLPPSGESTFEEKARTASVWANAVGVDSPKVLLPGKGQSTSMSRFAPPPKFMAPGASKPVSATSEHFAMANSFSAAREGILSGIAEMTAQSGLAALALGGAIRDDKKTAATKMAMGNSFLAAQDGIRSGLAKIATNSELGALAVGPVLQANNENQVSKVIRSASESLPKGSFSDRLSNGSFSHASCNDSLVARTKPTAASEHLERLHREDEQRRTAMFHANKHLLGNYKEDDTIKIPQDVSASAGTGTLPYGTMTAAQSLAAHQQAPSTAAPRDPVKDFEERVRKLNLPQRRQAAQAAQTKALQLPGQQTPGQPLPGRIVSGQLMAGPVLAGHMAPGQMISGQMFSGQMTPGHSMPGQMMPGQMMPGQMMPGQMFPGLPMPGQMPQMQTWVGAPTAHIPGQWEVNPAFVSGSYVWTGPPGSVPTHPPPSG